MNKTADTATDAVGKGTDTAVSGANKATGAATGTLPPLPARMDFSASQGQVLQWLPSWLISRWKAADEARPGFGDADGSQVRSTKRPVAKRRRLPTKPIK